ncbi:MAG: hypothetical protein ACJAZ8_000175 [Planctomycetota bacterium]|jgi:hypothetical protein
MIVFRLQKTSGKGPLDGEGPMEVGLEKTEIVEEKIPWHRRDPMKRYPTDWSGAERYLPYLIYCALLTAISRGIFRPTCPSA